MIALYTSKNPGGDWMVDREIKASAYIIKMAPYIDKVNICKFNKI